MPGEFIEGLQEPLNVARELLLFALVIAAAYTDIARNKVYDWTTVPAALLGLMIACIHRRLGDHVLGLALGLVVFGFFYFFRAIGAGDVKLMAAIGALKGARFAVATMCYTALVGFVLAFAFLIWHGKVREGLKSSVRVMFSPGRLRLETQKQEDQQEPSTALAPLPYGVAIAVGAIWAWFMWYVV